MQIATHTLQAADTQARWNQAIKDARAAAKAAGVPIKIRQNVKSCCRGCMTNEDLGLPEGDDTTAYAYTFGGQGRAIQWRNGNPVTEARRPARTTLERAVLATEAYWNHDNGSAEFLKQAFEANGFEVDWDGSDSKTVIVKFPEVVFSQTFHAARDAEGKVHWAVSKGLALSLAGQKYSYDGALRFVWEGGHPAKHRVEIQAQAEQALVARDTLAAAL